MKRWIIQWRKYNTIGQISILAAMGYLTDVDKNLMPEKGYSIITGNVGTMNAEKVFAAIRKLLVKF